MRVVVKVGEVSVTVEGLDYNRRQVRALLGAVYAVAALREPEEGAANPVGFSVITERASEPEAESYFTDDED